jgi:hypothetical protein
VERQFKNVKWNYGRLKQGSEGMDQSLLMCNTTRLRFLGREYSITLILCFCGDLLKLCKILGNVKLSNIVFMGI